MNRNRNIIRRSRANDLKQMEPNTVPIHFSAVHPGDPLRIQYLYTFRSFSVVWLWLYLICLYIPYMRYIWYVWLYTVIEIETHTNIIFIVCNIIDTSYYKSKENRSGRRLTKILLLRIRYYCILSLTNVRNKKKSYNYILSIHSCRRNYAFIFVYIFLFFS